jgi:anti-sigma B factor antagonist
MRIQTTSEGGVIAARIEGRFDAHTVDAYIEAVARKVGHDHPHVVLHMDDVEFMDSSALAALVTTLKRCIEHGGEIVLVSPAAPVSIILELTRLDEVFPRFDSPAEARLALAGAISR